MGLLNSKKIAIIVGSGKLPLEVISKLESLSVDYVVIKFNGVRSADFDENKVTHASFENIGELLTDLKSKKITRISIIM